MKAFLAQRSDKPERMDDAAQGGAELREALRHLRRLNRIFGASAPVLYGVKRLWRDSGKPRRFTVLDVGSGSGDLNRGLLRWADRQGLDVQVILADVTEEAREEAEHLFRDEPRVAFVKSDAFDLPAGYADYVTASQFAHHFPPDRLPSLIGHLIEVSRYGAVINDIHRHIVPWTAVWIATRLVSGNRYIRHDGPLSVAKGFRRADFETAAPPLETAVMQVRWRPLFRYAVTIRKQREEPGEWTRKLTP